MSLSSTENHHGSETIEELQIDYYVICHISNPKNCPKKNLPKLHCSNGTNETNQKKQKQQQPSNHPS